MCWVDLNYSEINNQYIYIYTCCRCVVPECESANSSVYAPKWLAQALPAGAPRERRCSRREPLTPSLETACEDDTEFAKEALLCDQWLYASNNTIVAEVCDDFHLFVWKCKLLTITNILCAYLYLCKRALHLSIPECFISAIKSNLNQTIFSTFSRIREIHCDNNTCIVIELKLYRGFAW